MSKKQRGRKRFFRQAGIVVVHTTVVHAPVTPTPYEDPNKEKPIWWKRLWGNSTPAS